MYIGKLIEIPISTGPILNIETCQEMNLSKITLYVKGGYMRNNISEKLIYTFNKQSIPASFYHYLQNFKGYPYSELDFIYNSNKQISKTNITRYMGFTNLPPVLFKTDTAKTLILTSKGNGRSDSLIYFPSINDPKLILSVVNNIVNSMEIVAENGSETEDWKLLASEIDSSLLGFALSAKTITFTENGLPLSSYDLDSNWNKKERIRSWEYNSENQPTFYKEWLHGSLVKLIEVTYQSNNLPEMFIIDRKKYIFHSEFHAK